MSLSLILAFVKANSTTLLALWIVFEQYLAANPKIKANSTFQLVGNIIKVLLSRKGV